MNEPTAPFESLPLPRRDVPGVGLHRYRVYKDAKNFTIVEAESVIDALRASGLKQAHRVLRDSLSLTAVLDMKMLTGESEQPKAPPAQAPVAAAPVAQAPVAQEAAPVAQPVAEASPAAAPQSPTEEVFLSTATAAEPAAEAAPEVPLSSDDVNKLLGN